MPGWYVHMEVAHQTAVKLRAGTVPAGYPISQAEAGQIGEFCHTWRNYLAIGALGPDLFYLLPDYANTRGSVIRQVMQWALDVLEVIDSQFVSKWEKWIDPISTNASQLSSQLRGGLNNQLAQALDSMTTALMSAFQGLLAQMGDLFGLLTSGVPQGYGDDAYYWSDMFHYRRTYQFPLVLFQNARAALDAATTDDERSNAQAQIAFAVGWMTHCATDVTGHPFTNAKCGGPYRDHWQRHHLVENHFDSENYTAINMGPCYGEYGTSALHFRIAFRKRTDPPYTGRDDGPAYDYFAGFPAYDTSEGPTPAAKRAALFDLDSGGLPSHLTDALLDAMAAVYPAGPKILTQDPRYSATDSNGDSDGRPNEDAMAQMWDIVYTYLKLVSRDGLSPARPRSPSVFTDHNFPTPPGSGSYGVDDDPTRGADVDDDSSFDVLDLLLALVAWPLYIAEIVVWLVTVLPGLIVDVLTFPAREVIYYSVVVPAWNLLLLARRSLVMAGFLTPKPEEVALSLTILGTSSGTFSIATALDDPLGAGRPVPTLSEPSGRLNDKTAFGLDQAYPRNVVRDKPADITKPDLLGALGLTGPLVYAGDAGVEFKPSEWVAPWRYPLKNHAGDWVPQEGAPAHVGPYIAGDQSTILLGSIAGDDTARAHLEACRDAAQTFKALDALLATNSHLGGPIDYSIYLVGRMVADRGNQFGVPDFNLDSDRGYAWHCWDWDRRDPQAPWLCKPDLTTTPQTDFAYSQACTPPHFFHAAHDNPDQLDAAGQPLDTQWYDPQRDLRTHYLETQADPCGKPSDPHDFNLGKEWAHQG